MTQASQLFRFLSTSGLLLMGLVGQQAVPEHPTFRAGINVVQLEVSVLAKDGSPVRDLTAGDFTVLEDGRQQKIVAFNKIEVPEHDANVSLSVDSRRLQVGADIISNQKDERRLVVIVMDDETFMQGYDGFASRCPEDACPYYDAPLPNCRVRPLTQAAPGRSASLQAEATGCPNSSAAERAREAARQVIERLGPNDLASVVFTSAAAPSQGFTNDKTSLDDAVDRFEEQGAPTCLNYQRAVRKLKVMEDLLKSAPGIRKIMIYIGGGVPVDFATQRIAFRNMPDDSEDCGPLAIDEMKEVFLSAQFANVSIYTVDPFGLVAVSERRSAAVLEIESDRIIAANTGGKAIIQTNDFSSDLAQIFRDNSVYYVLGYEPSNSKQDGKIRKIDLK